MTLRVSNLSFNYQAKQALKDVSFDAEKGRFTALLGPNGAGKSTLFGLLTRLLTVNNGVIEVAGIDLRQHPLAALAKMGIVFQQPTLDLDLSVQQNLRYFAALHGLSGKSAEMRIEASLDRLGMRERAKEKLRKMNGGHRRRTELARALLHEPSVLLLDEPTVGLDASSRTAITDHVHQLTADGLTVLWSTHLTDEVHPDDALILLHQGVLKEAGTAKDLQNGQSLQDWFLVKTGAEA